MSWICPSCYSADAPVWTWVKIQGEEAIRVPTCPDCGYEMEEAAHCPLCFEPMRKNHILCRGCWELMVFKLKEAGKPWRRIVPELDIMYAINEVSGELVNRMEEQERQARK